MAVNFDARCFFHGRGIRLMRRFFQHAREAKKFAVARFINDDFLLIFVDGGHADFARDHHVSVTLGIADFVNTLTRRERSLLDLRRKDRGLFVIEQRKKGYVFQFLRIARHWPPRRIGLLRENGRAFHKYEPRDKSYPRKPRFGVIPVQGNFMRLHRPVRKLRFAHVRREQLHGAAVWHSADKIHQRLLIAPHGEGPKLPMERPRIH